MKYLKLLIGISALFTNYAFAQISNKLDSIKQLKEITITYQADKLTPITFQNISSKDLKAKSTGQEPTYSNLVVKKGR
jgi:iron complex outermembrane receptor protein